jgi:hypothetical protein
MGSVKDAVMLDSPTLPYVSSLTMDGFGLGTFGWSSKECCAGLLPVLTGDSSQQELILRGMLVHLVQFPPLSIQRRLPIPSILPEMESSSSTPHSLPLTPTVPKSTSE